VFLAHHLNRCPTTLYPEIFHSLEDAVIKEEEEEDEDLSYLHNRWENDSD
jgi:hypothetical protein